MLQNVVSKIPVLYSVKTQAAHDIAHDKPPLTYDNYKTLLLSAATVEDEKLSFSTTRAQRTVQTHDQFEFTRDNDTTFNIDTDINTLVVHSTDRTSTHPPRGRFWPSMTRDQWNGLSSNDKVFRGSFLSHTKATILGFKNLRLYLHLLL